ncbi:MAG TPA: phosphate signaling complex protein PhoU [Pseudonocardia sp.]|nr:phosphate signaling complex protein PhoU [Pseudonocardia sp.]
MAPPPLAAQLGTLAELLERMCVAVAAGMRDATAALVDRWPRLAEQVIARDAEVDALRAEVEHVASEALLFHAPVAGDLRAVVAAIRSAGDLERMGDLAQHVAEAVRRRAPQPAVPAEVCDAFAEMGRLAVGLARKAGEVVRTRNVVLAAELDGDDDEMDRLHRRMMSVLLHPSWPHGVPAAVDLALLARFYERFADHAVVVARETVYAVTGREPEELPL